MVIYCAAYLFAANYWAFEFSKTIFFRASNNIPIKISMLLIEVIAPP